MTKKGHEGKSFARQVAFQALYRREANPDISDVADDEFIRTELSRLTAEPRTVGAEPPVNEEPMSGEPLDERQLDDLAAFVRRLLGAVREHSEEIDAALESAALNWRLSRMSATDRNILRLAVGEIRFEKSPVPVVINEAIELAKKFGSNDSAPFINGVLGKIVKR